MAYNAKTLDEALVSIMPNFEGLIKGHMRTRLCLDAAATCWIENIEENEHTIVIREALGDLWKQGWFNFIN